MTSTLRSDLTGNRIRERRLARGMRQGALAEAVGISPSYLNLIEHSHRRIGGKLLLDLAEALDVEVAVLTEGAAEGLTELLRVASRMGEGDVSDPPEVDRIDEFTARFPGWSAAIAAQERHAEALEAQIEALRDRLAHDTGLAEAMHEVLSSVAAIRSTADILAREADLDPAWRGRFHRNLHEEAERLSDRATGLVDQFELPAMGSVDPGRRALEAVEAIFDLNDNHFAEIEERGELAIEAVLARSTGLETREAQALARSWLRSYAEDAARLPLARFQEAAAQVGYDPAGLMALAAGDVALVLRRLAQLPPQPGLKPFGIAQADAAGALLFRRRIPGFTLARFGARCPRWPLYRAFARPGQPEVADLKLPGGARMRSWAVAQEDEAMGFGHAPVLRSTMLVQPLDGEASEDDTLIEVGPDCPTCRATGHVPRS